MNQQKEIQVKRPLKLKHRSQLSLSQVPFKTAVGVCMAIVAGVVFYFFAFERSRNEPVEFVAVTGAVEQESVIRHPLHGAPLREELQEPFIPALVMYDGSLDVTSRPGLESAGVVYEALTEGGIVRLMAVFDSSAKVPRFGPIRSTRSYFIDWAEEYGGIYMHVGGSPEALTRLRNVSKLTNIDEMSRGHYFERDTSLPGPLNVFSTFSSWLRIKEQTAMPASAFVTWKFEEQATRREESAGWQIEMNFSPSYSMGWVYDASEGAYLRFVNGERDMYANGNQVKAHNLVAIEVPSKTVDSIGRQDMKTIGSGKAFIMSAGEKIAGWWIKESPAGRMRFVTENQEEVVFVPGVTWIEVLPNFDALRETAP